MKKIYFILLLSVASVNVNAQVFWQETFSNTCLPRGNEASAYSGSLGPWTITATGANDDYGNQWYINDRVMFNGLGNCAKGNDLNCQPAPDNSLHIGGKAITSGGTLGINFPADSASYWTGFFCQFGYCNATNLRVESPPINCTGKSNITLSFVYYEGGAAAGKDEDAVLCYYDGTAWTVIDAIAKTVNSCANVTGLGSFTSYAVTLPQSADNNANIKIGFNWDNDTITDGTDPSFAVDNITLSSGSVPTCSAVFTLAADTSQAHTYIATNYAYGLGPIQYDWSWGDASHSYTPYPSHTYADSGFYDICLTITDSAGCSSTYCDTTFHALRTTNNPVYINVVPPIGTGIKESALNANDVIVYPNPAKEDVVIQQSSAHGYETIAVSVLDLTGRVIQEKTVEWTGYAIMNIKSLPAGIYFLELKGETERVVKRFVKE